MLGPCGAAGRKLHSPGQLRGPTEVAPGDETTKPRDRKPKSHRRGHRIKDDHKGNRPEPRNTPDGAEQAEQSSIETISHAQEANRFMEKAPGLFGILNKVQDLGTEIDSNNGGGEQDITGLLFNAESLECAVCPYYCQEQRQREKEAILRDGYIKPEPSGKNLSDARLHIGPEKKSWRSNTRVGVESCGAGQMARAICVFQFFLTTCVSAVSFLPLLGDTRGITFSYRFGQKSRARSRTRLR